jgi:hypothetical protein
MKNGKGSPNASDKSFKHSAVVEQMMKEVFQNLSEKGRRLYAAVEASKLPHGGIEYISNILNCNRKTIWNGMKELKNSENLPPKNRDRRKGGGRKRVIETTPGINEKFLKVLEEHTAGDPMNEKIKWTNLDIKDIIQKLKGEGINVGKHVVKQLLKQNNYVKRKVQKNERIGSCEYRNEQFENIAMLKAEYESMGNPVISVDTKKKEHLGNLYREGKVYCTGIIGVFDHDFPHLATGIVIPHTLYDIKNNKAFVNIGTSKDTGEFACDSIKYWWYNVGRFDYPNATSILILADSGGSNSCRHYLFKEDLQKLVDEIKIEIRVAHYPPYTSKWNPVEHRVFPHVTRALQGVVFRNHELVKELIENTSTKTGLKVEANIIKKVYKTGRKYATDFKETMRIVFDEYLGQWNYRVVPLRI